MYICFAGLETVPVFTVAALFVERLTVGQLRGIRKTPIHHERDRRFTDIARIGTYCRMSILDPIPTPFRSDFLLVLQTGTNIIGFDNE